MLLRSRVVFGVACLFVACGGKAPAQSARARGIVLSEQEPPAGYVRAGELSVKSGKGCGMLGERGSREDAEARLRNEAVKLGARYVRVTSYEPPRPNHQCLEHEHKLSGIAFRDPADAPAPTPEEGFVVPADAPPPDATSSVGAVPTPPPAPTTSAEHAAPPRVCVPGATQACLGPGACQGAQACRDDASGFLPCDCGPAPTP